MADDFQPQKGSLNNDNKNSSLDDQPPEIKPIADHEGGFIAPNPAHPTAQGKLKRFWKWEWPHVWWRKASKKERIIGSVIVAVLLLAGGAGVYALNSYFAKPGPTPSAPIVEKKAPEPPKTTEPSRLTGVEIPVALNKRAVTALQIENSPDARPQSGLKDAGIVFEAIAEGGITRFNAMFLEGQPDYIGPVRSIRPYYIDFFLPFDAALGHAGGSGDGLARVAALGVKDLDYTKANAYRRVSDRFAPHNLYTSMADLDRVSREKGFTTSTFKSWLRKKEAPGQPITAKSIDLAISGPLYDVHYDYDPVKNVYQRSEGGKPHVDQKSGQVLSPKVVVALIMNWSQNGIYSVYQTTGSGGMVVFQDGVAQRGAWKKASPKEQFEFVGEDGKPIAFNPGQTWVSIVRAPADIKYVPN